MEKNKIKFNNLIVKKIKKGKKKKLSKKLNSIFDVIKKNKTENQTLDKLSDFKKDELNIEAIGSKQFAAQKIADQVGWQ